MSEQENPKGFKVTDRRSFTSEGERRPDAEQPDVEEDKNDAESSSSGASVSAIGLEEASETDGGRAAGPTSSSSPRTGAHAGPEAPTQTEIPAFMDLLGLLATQASLALGEPHPMTGETHEDIHAARATISMIEALSDKTKGNLTKAESETLQAILYQLRMQYVAKAKAGGG
jgi:hypothetical protein